MTDHSQGGASAPPSGGSEEYDESLVDAADRLLRAALRGTTFRLAVRCDVCGTWVTHPASVRRHRGPVCAKRAQEQEGAA